MDSIMSLCELFDILLIGSKWKIGCCEVTLVEDTNCLWAKSTDDGVEDTAVVEDDQIIRFPVCKGW